MFTDFHFKNCRHLLVYSVSLAFMITVLSCTVFFSASVCSELKGTPEEDKICFYADPNFKGFSECFNVGRSIESLGRGLANRVSSVRVFGNAWARTYEHSHYRGKSGFIFMDGHLFGRDNNDIQSLTVHRRTTDDFACFFEHEGYGGAQQCYESGGQFSNLDYVFLGRNRASSVQTAGNVLVRGYEDRNLKKDVWSHWFSAGILGSEENNNVDSFKIIGKDISDLPDYFTRMYEQRALSDRAPLNLSYLLGTNSSFNAFPYRKYLTELGPNQMLTISEQLHLGVRFLEIELHDGNDGDVTSCRSSDCNNANTHIHPARLVAEIHNYLKGNKPNDFIVVFLNNKMESLASFQEIKEIIDTGIGRYVYRPKVSAGACQDTPFTETIENMRKSGKKILFSGVGCSENVKTSGLNKWAFSTAHPSLEANKDGEEFNYERSTILSDDFTRVFECWNPTCYNTVNGSNVQRTLQAGPNVVAIDQINNNDIYPGGRLLRQLWSWRQDQLAHNNHNSNVAVVSRDGTTSLGSLFKAAGSLEIHPYACLMPTGQWHITGVQGGIWGGRDACRNIGGNFDLPLTPRESRRLFQALPKGVTAFVNYGTAYGKRKIAQFNTLTDRLTLPLL